MPKWSIGATKELQNIQKRYHLSAQTASDLRQQAQGWAERRIAEDPDEGALVSKSDVSYTWAYMMICMMGTRGGNSDATE